MAKDPSLFKTANMLIKIQNQARKKNGRNREWETYGADEVRGSEYTFSAPKRVVEIRNMAFQLGREATVHHGDSAAFTEEI